MYDRPETKYADSGEGPVAYQQFGTGPPDLIYMTSPRFERKGLIHRSPDPEDRLVIRLGMTDSGRALINEAFTTSLSVYQSMLNEFSPTQVKMLEALLGKLLRSVDTASDSGVYARR